MTLTLTPEQELAFFGPPPLLKGEDPTKYNQLLAYISSTVVPADIFERVFARTVVDLVWETNRYRRLIADVLGTAEQGALERVLKLLIEGTGTPLAIDDWFTSKSQELAKQYTLRQQAATDEVNALLASAGQNWETVEATAFSMRRQEIEALNRLIASAEARMKSTLREIDRHRKGFGQQLRQAIKQLDDPSPDATEEGEEQKRAA